MVQTNTKAEKIILGIDPGTNVMGYGVIRVCGKKAEMLALGIIDLRKYGDHYLKLGQIFERITGIIDSYPTNWQSKPRSSARMSNRC